MTRPCTTTMTLVYRKNDITTRAMNGTIWKAANPIRNPLLRGEGIGARACSKPQSSM